MSEKLSPERAVRVLRAKASDLENAVLADYEHDKGLASRSRLTALSADVALIATLLADHIERSEPVERRSFFNADGTASDWDGTYPDE